MKVHEIYSNFLAKLKKDESNRRKRLDNKRKNITLTTRVINFLLSKYTEKEFKESENIKLKLGEISDIPIPNTDVLEEPDYQIQMLNYLFEQRKSNIRDRRDSNVIIQEFLNNLEEDTNILTSTASDIQLINNPSLSINNIYNNNTIINNNNNLQSIIETSNTRSSQQNINRIMASILPKRKRSKIESRSSALNIASPSTDNIISGTRRITRSVQYTPETFTRNRSRTITRSSSSTPSPTPKSKKRPITQINQEIDSEEEIKEVSFKEKEEEEIKEVNEKIKEEIEMEFIRTGLMQKMDHRIYVQMLEQLRKIRLHGEISSSFNNKMKIAFQFQDDNIYYPIEMINIDENQINFLMNNIYGLISMSNAPITQLIREEKGISIENPIDLREEENLSFYDSVDLTENITEEMTEEIDRKIDYLLDLQNKDTQKSLDKRNSMETDEGKLDNSLIPAAPNLERTISTTSSTEYLSNFQKQAETLILFKQAAESEILPNEENIQISNTDSNLVTNTDLSSFKYYEKEFEKDFKYCGKTVSDDDLEEEEVLIEQLVNNLPISDLTDETALILASLPEKNAIKYRLNNLYNLNQLTRMFGIEAAENIYQKNPILLDIFATRLMLIGKIKKQMIKNIKQGKTVAQILAILDDQVELENSLSHNIISSINNNYKSVIIPMNNAALFLTGYKNKKDIEIIYKCLIKDEMKFYQMFGTEAFAYYKRDNVEEFILKILDIGNNLYIKMKRELLYNIYSKKDFLFYIFILRLEPFSTLNRYKLMYLPIPIYKDSGVYHIMHHSLDELAEKIKNINPKFINSMFGYKISYLFKNYSIDSEEIRFVIEMMAKQRSVDILTNKYQELMKDEPKLKRILQNELKEAEEESGSESDSSGSVISENIEETVERNIKPKNDSSKSEITEDIEEETIKKKLIPNNTGKIFLKIKNLKKAKEQLRVLSDKQIINHFGKYVGDILIKEKNQALQTNNDKDLEKILKIILDGPLL